ncbi:hypothetical protein niasHT_001725 [Heterodera trifolii]|uniref:Uncharacterized protein n=1 Tax=Heterodera trifolii TaxID=157864 RepID=A0ABD2MF56_9BILA
MFGTDTCGVLLANAMASHMGRKEWPQLDKDELYSKQRIRFDEKFSWKGFGRRVDEAIAELFSVDHPPTEEMAQITAERRPRQNETVHVHINGQSKCHQQNGISDSNTDLERGIIPPSRRGTFSPQRVKFLSPNGTHLPLQTNGDEVPAIIDSKVSAFSAVLTNGHRNTALHRRHSEAKGKKNWAMTIFDEIQRDATTEGADEILHGNPSPTDGQQRQTDPNPKTMPPPAGRRARSEQRWNRDGGGPPSRRRSACDI